MATRAEVDAFRRALTTLSSRAVRDLRTLWAPVAGADFADQRRALDAVWPDLIATYGDMSATVAADMLDEWLGGATVEMVRPVDEGRALARMRWALGTPEVLGNLTLLADELVKQPARSTVARTAEINNVRYARVPTGAETCAYCLMIASRGAVYRSEAAALAVTPDKYHGRCDCAPVAVRSLADLPASYDQEALEKRYLDAREAAGSGDPKDILAKMREQNPGTH